MFKILGVEFDDSRGEMFYNDLVPNVIEQLKEKNLLIESEGAQVVKLEDFDLTDAVILKSDGTIEMIDHRNERYAAVEWRNIACIECKFFNVVGIVGKSVISDFV